MNGVAERRRADKQIQMRVNQQVRDLIDRAAAATGKSRSEFMLDSARATATDVLLDQRLFELDPAQWDELIAALDQSPRPNAALKALMKSSAPWE